jgi:hypothetical protein
MNQLLLVEFAGVFNGPEGRIVESFASDLVLNTAKSIVEDKNLFITTMSNDQIIENWMIQLFFS